MPNKKELPRYRQLLNRVRLLIFPGSTCSLNSIPYFPDQVRRCIVWIVASNGDFRNKMMVSCITVFVDTMITPGPYEDKSGIF